MILSHSKLQTILTNPMDYYLGYKLGIKPKEPKPYFLVGSAVHWGLEHNTEDLTDYFKENGTLEQRTTYSQEQFQAEAMVHGFYVHKEQIMKEVFDDYESHEPLKLVDNDSEFHELDIQADLPSFIHPNEPHKFVGIIDLLFLTEKGFILMDYKTSSTIPDFNKYLDQLYRYIFELNSVFPGVPVYKIGIINLVKSKIKKKQNESNFDFKQRYQEQYEQDFNHLISVHMFEPSLINQEEMKDYIINLSRAADLAETIDKNGLFWLNMEGAVNPYPSVYLDIYHKEPQCFMSYTIKDTWYNDSLDIMENKRDCVPLDMEVVNNQNILNQYSKFKELMETNQNLGLSEKNSFFNFCKKNFKCDDYLLDNYWYTYHLRKGNR